ncbi:MAG: hypothetical protein GF308_00710 [Candidatus Heimdallarchaeota archaeon]|nr:hypothetical protein [Candidatus Heimdallarchaeota archaeon]
MFDRLLGFRNVHRKIEEKIIQFAFLPSKYFEALYVECSTGIHCHTLNIIEMEEKNLRDELLDLMKEGEVDTRIELEKFKLFERLHAVNSKMEGIRLVINEFSCELPKDRHKELMTLLKGTSKVGKKMHQGVKALYENFDQAFVEIENLNNHSKEIIQNISRFKYYNNNSRADWNPESPVEKVGTSLRAILQEMIMVGEKIVEMIKILSFNHKQTPKDGSSHQLKSTEEEETKNSLQEPKD